MDKTEDTDWRRLLSDEEILWEYSGTGPHAGFSIGSRHSGSYFNSDVLFAKPDLHEEIASWFVVRLRERGVVADAVIAREPYSSRLALPMAKRLNLPLVHYGDEPLGKKKSFILFADDVYSGGLIREIVASLRSSGASVVEPVCVIANFSGRGVFEGLPLLSLVETGVTSPAWTPEECPLCKNGSPLLPARAHWAELIRG